MLVVPARFEVLTAVLIKIHFFWDVTLCHRPVVSVVLKAPQSFEMLRTACWVTSSSSSSSFGTTTLCGFSASQPSLSKSFYPQLSPSSFSLSAFLDLPLHPLCHCCLGLPTGLVPIGLQSNSFPVGLARSIRCICPSNLILCALMNLTISAPTINLSIYMLFHILHMLSILTGPNIFLSICLSVMRRLFSSFAVKSPSLRWIRNDRSYHRFIYFHFGGFLYFVLIQCVYYSVYVIVCSKLF